MSPSEPFFGSPFRDFEYLDGVHLARSVLWCDTDRKQGLNFRSSAGVGEIGKNRKLVCTPPTQRLLSRGKGKVEALTAPFDKRFGVGELELSLHPSGHGLGAAQLRIVRDERVLVYAHNVCPRSSSVSPGAESVPCDALALAVGFGRRGLVFPEREAVLEQIRAFLDGALHEKKTPVLLASALGVGPDLAVALGRAGYRLRLHRALADVLKAHAEEEVAVPEFKRLAKKVGRSEVVIAPPILRTQLPDIVPDGRLAFVGPRATDAAHVHGLQVAAAFALSNVAGYEELVAFVEQSGAQEVFLAGPEGGDLAETLTGRGHIVHQLLPPQQLDLF